MTTNPPLAHFIKRVEFYKPGNDLPFEKVEVPWWEIDYLWQQLEFTDVSENTIYMDFDAEVSKVTLRQLIDHFLAESRKEGSIYSHETWQKNIAEDLSNLRYGLEHPKLKRVKVLLGEG